MIARADVNQTLLNYLTAAPGLVGVFKTATTALIHWKDLQKAEKSPALLIPHADESEPGGDWGTAYAWHLTFNARVYTYTGKIDGSAGAQLDGLIEAISAALGREPLTKRQTLGGKVFDARISGRVKTDGGLLGAQAFAEIPITVRNI